MYFQIAFHSNDSALRVASVVHAFVERQIDSGYFDLVGTDAGGTVHEFQIRPILDQFFMLEVDDSQVVEGKTMQGRRVQLCFPPIPLRAVLPVGVLVEAEPLPASDVSSG